MRISITLCTALLLSGLMTATGSAPASAGVEGTIINITGYGGGGSAPDVSDDGRFLAFGSWATDLTSDTPNGQRNIFVHDTLTGETINITRAANGYSDRHMVSADGSTIVFRSRSTNLIPGWIDSNGTTFDLFTYDVASGLLGTLYSPAGLHSSSVSISGDSRYLVGELDGGAIVLVDRAQGATNHLVVDESGRDPHISDDGEFVVFTSTDPNLRTAEFNGQPHVYLWERQTGEFTEVTPNANEFSSGPTINADGSFVGFVSRATNLTPNDINGHDDFFLWSRDTGEIENITESANAWTWGGVISADGNRVALTTRATNLTDDVGRAQNNVVIWDRVTDEFTNLTAHGNNESAGVRMSADGTTVGFIGSASNLTDGDINGQPDTMIWRGPPPPTPPKPVDPEPVDPEPVDPEPVDPEPVDPEPVDPEPVDPGPTGPTDPDPADIWMAEATTFDEFVNSADFNPTLHGEILRLYPAFFNREPELAGAQYWILDVYSTGQNIDQITQYFSDPTQTEFVKFYEDIPADDNAQYLTRVYFNMLNRVPDADGFNYWLNLMNRGELDRGSVVRWVALNEEFIERYNYGN